MKKKSLLWKKPVITLLVLAILVWILPVTPIDPWNLINPKKIATMILALAMIQAFGSAMAHHLGTRTGALLTGFFGGLVSSTVTTASLARQSKVRNQTDVSNEMLIFLSATCAMLFEGIALVMAGTTEIHFSTLLIFIGPALATLGLIFVHYRKLTDRKSSLQTSNFEIWPTLKLAAFILAMLTVSKIFQSLFGQNGLLALTSIVSLFEIHGSVIANVQLQESGAVSVDFLCNLLAVSIVASYLSKLFLISTLGSSALKSQVFKNTFLLFCVLAISWAAVKI